MMASCLLFYLQHDPSAVERFHCVNELKKHDPGNLNLLEGIRGTLEHYNYPFQISVSLSAVNLKVPKKVNEPG